MRAVQPPSSSPERDRQFGRLTGQPWDLLVVGGGISGVAVARDAALRGLRVALIEQDDFAFGTSSRSSRLIHGGLRYLANLDVALVREGLVERKRLLDAAPGLVRAVPFLYPVYRDDPDPLWKVRFGVWLYETLALGYALGGHQRLTPEKLVRLAPGLDRNGLTGAVAYRDAATHDTRLTLAVALAAQQAGATLVSRCRAGELIRSEHGVHGAVVEDRLTGASRTVESKATVLCCGPWQKLYATTQAPVVLRTARGTHLSLPAARLPVDGFLALRSPDDGRLTFAMPVGRYTVVGTTDEDDHSPPSLVRPTVGDRDYLLRLINDSFPGQEFGEQDIVGIWAGLRPLLADGSGEDADELSRRHQVVAGAPGLWILTGGKLTTHRRMAEDCVERITPYLRDQQVDVGPCQTRNQPLFSASLDEALETLRRRGGAAVDEQLLADLAGLYGARLGRLVFRRTDAADSDSLLNAQIDLAVEEEWTLSLDDLLLRRLLPGQLDLHACWKLAPFAAQRMAQLLNWTDSQVREQVGSFRDGIQRDLSSAGLPAPASAAD